MNGSPTELAAELPLIGEALPARAGCINVAVSEALVALYDAPAGSLLTLPLALGGVQGGASPGSKAPSPIRTSGCNWSACGDRCYRCDC